MGAVSIRCNEYEISRQDKDLVIRQIGQDGKENLIRITPDQLEVFFAHMRIAVSEVQP